MAIVSIRLIKVLWPGKLLIKVFSDSNKLDFGPIRSQTLADRIKAQTELLTKPLAAPHIAYVVGPDFEIGNILGVPREGKEPVIVLRFGLNSLSKKCSHIGKN